MDLRNNQITVRELRSNPKAKEILDRELPGLLDMQIAAIYPSMTLEILLGFSGVPQSKIDKVIAELEKI